MDTDIFFPEGKEGERAAKEICAGCMIRNDCLEYARVMDDRYGIWGGMTFRERSE